ncbi:MAG TPA: hypothetical protein VMF04_00410 [Thermoplasmata archaeon]|nr:hypothetical protein [Thermoplasmata archaeon]
MNRTILGMGVAILLIGFALIGYPIAVTGQEQFDPIQELGLFFLAPAFGVMLIGAISDDPRVTTVGGAFGNPEVDLTRRPTKAPVATRTGIPYHPHEPVRCRFCGAIITADLSQCPRCARARECRTCGRPLGTVLNRVTCPMCARAEALCNCPHVPPRAPTGPVRGRRA